MIHQSQLRSSTRCRPAFHPTDAKVIFAAQGGQGHEGQPRRRRALGAGPGGKGDSPHLPERPEGGFAQMGTVPFSAASICGEIAIDPGHPQRMMAGDQRSVVLSDDGGKTWRACQGPQGQTVAFHFDQTTRREPPHLLRGHQRRHLAVRRRRGHLGGEDRRPALERHPLVLRRLPPATAAGSCSIASSQPGRGRQVCRRRLQVHRPRRNLDQRDGRRDQHGHQGRRPVGPGSHRPVPVGADDQRRPEHRLCLEHQHGRPPAAPHGRLPQRRRRQDLAGDVLSRPAVPGLQRGAGLHHRRPTASSTSSPPWARPSTPPIPTT